MKKITILLLVVLGIAACSKTEERFSTDYACNFVFRGDYHRGAYLLRTMDNPGLYAIVESRTKNGITYLYTTLNDGVSKDTIPLTTAVETHYNYAAMGANRALIIGCSNFEGPKAWDRQCRHCLDNTAGNNYPLSFCDNGRNVKCGKCDRVYVLETGSSDDGHRLFEYAVRYNPAELVIQVNNK